MVWRTFLGLGFVSLVAAGCTATVNGGVTNDGGPDANGTGGASTGGSSQGGTGGKSSTGGTTSSGGASQGGSGGGSAGAGGSKADAGPAVCHPETDTDKCQKCVDTYCCQEYNDCSDATCAGNSDGGTDGELACMITCLQDGLAGKDGGFTSRQDCSDKCKKGGAVLAQNTQAVITCMTAPSTDGGTVQRCAQDCFGGQVQ